MKRYQTANRLFLASAILFGAAVILQHASPWSGSEAVSIFYFLAQSCLIGCCAELDRRRSPLPEALPSAVQAADSVEPRCRHQETVRRQRFPDRQDRPFERRPRRICHGTRRQRILPQ